MKPGGFSNQRMFYFPFLLLEEVDQSYIAEVNSRLPRLRVDLKTSTNLSPSSRRLGSSSNPKYVLLVPIQRCSDLTDVFSHRMRATPILRRLNSGKLLGRVRRNRIGRRSCRKEESSNLANTSVVDVPPFQRTVAVYFMYNLYACEQSCVYNSP